MTDGRALARAYLEQQRALGSGVVVRADRRTDGRADGTVVVGWSDGRTEGAMILTTDPGPDPPAGATARPPVRLTALPTAGLTFDPPAGDLFSDDPIQGAATLDAVAALVAECRRCRLCEGRTNTVPGEGPRDARLVVVGEGPGRTEDETGRPFVGRAGELLTKILAAIDFPRDRVFICNVVKCRPPENRVPLYDEIQACVPYLFRQIELLKPTVILALGGAAAQTLLDTKQSLGALRNQVHRFRGIPVIVTYHPAALLRNPNWKRPTWDDVRIARRLLD